MCRALHEGYMKIIYDHDVFGWQKYGGISRYYFELARALTRDFGEDARIVCPFYVNAYLKEGRGDVKVWGLPVKRLPKSRTAMRTVNSLLSRPVMRRVQPDIVHETYYSSRRLAPPRAKVVLTVFDMIHERFSDHFPPDDPTRIEKSLAVQRADHILCISEQTREDLIELLGVKREKTCVTYLGFSNVGIEESSVIAPPPRKPFLLYVGERRGYKNFGSLLEAYASSPMLRADFDLVCFGGKGFSAGEKAAMENYGLRDGVRQVSGSDKVLAAHYASASAFIYPSLYEGFGIPPLEAMSKGCPVICSDVSSIPEVVGDAARMFDPHSPEAIRAAIEAVLNDEAARNTLISRGRERVKLFSWDRCARETLDVYRRVLS